MSGRLTDGVERAAPFFIQVDGEPVGCHPGETVAAAMLAHDMAAVRGDTRGRERGLFCNMGTCGECFVEIDDGSEFPRTVRACLLVVREGLIVRRRSMPGG